MRLQDKRTLVTGGSDGIGLAIAEAFLREGADVLIVGRDAGKLETARRKLTAHGPAGAVETVSADLATSLGVATVIEHVKETGQPLDVLVNNAGVAYLVPFETVNEAQFQHSFALNVTAAFFLTQGLLQHFGAGASVINISSYFASKMIPKRPSSLYSLSKGALNSLTKSLAFELGPRGIRINAIAPGTVDTAMRRKTVDNLPIEAQAELKAYVERSYPLGRFGRPDDLAAAWQFISPAAKRHGPVALFSRSTVDIPRGECRPSPSTKQLLPARSPVGRNKIPNSIYTYHFISINHPTNLPAALITSLTHL